MTDPGEQAIDVSTESSIPSRIARASSRRAFLGTTGTSLAAIASSGAVRARCDANAAVAGDLESETETGTESETEAEVEVVVDFDPPELPESIAIDESGTVYLSLAVTGEIRAIEPDGSRATVTRLDVGEEGLLFGLVVRDGTIHAALSSGEPDTHGVWRIDVADGDAERAAELPAAETAPNGIVRDPYEPNAVLVSDHQGGAIWRVAGSEAEPWVDDEVLDPDPDADPGVGADGLAVHPDGDVYVDNLDYGRIVRVPVDADGAAGEPELIVEDEELVGADGMAFDVDGALYVAVNARDALIRLTPGPDPETETLAEGDPLDFPADVSFGRGEAGEASLYAGNFAFERFLTEPETAEPSLARLDAGTQGFFGETAEPDREREHEREREHDAEPANEP